MHFLPDDHFDVEDLICNESFQEYCLGSTLEHQLLWQEWISRFPERQQDITEAQELVNILNVRQGNRTIQLKRLRSGLTQSEALKTALRKQIHELPAPIKPAVLNENPAEKRQFPVLRYLMGVAAMLLVVAVISLYVRPLASSKTDPVTFANFFSSGKSLRKTVILKDGSVITLARGSSISLTAGFNAVKRELTLNGEAFFDVKHDAVHPFIVHTTFNDIKVLGTTFNVKAYQDSSSMETVLIKGRVRIDSKQYPGCFVVLQPNQKLVEKQDNSSKPSLLPAANYQVSVLKHGTNVTPEEIQWVSKRLDLNNLPLSVIAQKLQDWYGIEVVVIGEEVKNYRYSGVFENETILKILEALQLSYPFQFEMERDKITIKK